MKQSVKHMTNLKFVSALTTIFPDILSESKVTSKQLNSVGVHLNCRVPREITDERLSRGVFGVSFIKETLGTSIETTTESQTQALVQNILPMTAKPKVPQTIGTPKISTIPLVDKNYVKFGIHSDIDTVIKSGQFFPVYISGPTGNGKSTAVEQCCALNKRELIRINLNSMTDEDQLIGSKTLVDGNVEIVEGPVLIAMRAGSVLLLDEIDAGSANTLLCLQPILEGKPYYFKLKNEMIYPAPGYNIFSTGNTKGKGSDDGRYIGTNVLNEAFLERFSVCLEQDYPSVGAERKIVMNLMESFKCTDKEFADVLVKWADTIRKTFTDGGVDETVTTRRLVHIVRAFSIYKDKKKAVKLCTNRFDDVTRAAFLDVFDKLSIPVLNPIPQTATETEKMESF